MTDKSQWDSLGKRLEPYWNDNFVFDVRVDKWKDKRTLEQNNKIQAMCREIGQQVDPSVHEDDWRHILAATFRAECEEMENPRYKEYEGRVFLTGVHTRHMKVDEMSKFIEWLYAHGAEHDVEWGDGQ